MKWKEYLSFTKRERNGIITLVVLVLLLAVMPKLFPKAKIVEIVAADSSGKIWQEVGRKPTYSYGRYKDIDDEEYNKYPASYRYKKVDYGRREDGGSEWKGHSNYRIKENDKYGRKENSRSYRTDPPWKAGSNNHWPPKDHSFTKREVIDINKADTSAFIALPGIGGKLAARIILFREKLGGFNQIEQVREVYGLPDSTYSYIAKWLACNTYDVQKININEAPLERLSRHPYLRGNIASALLNYRKQHGAFQSLEDLRKIQSLPPSDLEKILPYLSLN